MRARLALTVLAALAAALALAAPAGATLPAGAVSAVDPGAAREITFPNDALSRSYSPSGLLIDAGQQVTWTANVAADFNAHPLVFVGEASPAASAIGMLSFQRTFDAAGTFRFHCAIHASMTGTIYVQGTPVAAIAATAPHTNVPSALDAGPSDELNGAIVAYAWDLDDDGTFELDTAGAPKTVVTWGTGPHTVRVRVTDGRGRTDIAQRTFDVQPAPPPPPPSGPSGTPGDTLAPVLSLGRPARPTAAHLARTGLVLHLGSSEAGTYDVRLVAGTRTLAHVGGRLGTAARTLRLRPRRAVLRGLRRGTRLRLAVVVRDGAGNAARRTITLRLR